MEIQQSPLYARYVQSLGWTVEKLGGVQIFIRNFFLIGALVKIHRPRTLPDPQKLIPLLGKYHVRQLALEAAGFQDGKKWRSWQEDLAKYFKLNHSPFLPTKTILIDLTSSETEIFNRFSEAKRRAVRRALKNNLQIIESADINKLIRIKNKSAGFLGFITTYGLDKLWSIFAPDNAAILLAASPNRCISQSLHLPIAGVLLLFCDKTAYYWIAGATREGKKLFAPTLLVWEALKLAKKRGAKFFDFVGVWDERLPQQNHAWKGFTKFKEGFDGKVVYYPLP